MADAQMSKAARDVIDSARTEAQGFKHNYIGTEHLLLGLLNVNGTAQEVLTNLGINQSKVRAATTFIIGRGDRMVVGEIGLTPRAKKVIELGLDEMRRMRQTNFGTEHILLGLIREGEGIACGVLEGMDASFERIRNEVQRLVSYGSALTPEDIKSLFEAIEEIPEQGFKDNINKEAFVDYVLNFLEWSQPEIWVQAKTRSELVGALTEHALIRRRNLWEGLVSEKGQIEDPPAGGN